ncbi:hypothetical protein C0991_000310 [Blastosporella zonata]|nr:hypothetical protein C0991_000310 [Blastosporella zonata]
MGGHSNMQMHKRVAALKQRRLPPDVEASKLKELVARFSPTVIYTDVYTQTLTDNNPTTTSAPPLTTSAADPSPNIPQEPATTSQPAISTPTLVTPTDAQVTTTSSVDPGTLTTTSDAVPTTDTETDALTTTSAIAVVTPLTTSTPVVAVTTPATTPAVLTTAPLTVLTTASPTIASAAAGATETSSSGSGTNIGGVVGGLAGGLLGIVVLAFAVRFIMKRQRKRRETDEGAFSATDFRRSAVLMDDPPTHDETVERGFNPRPPTMIERRLASPAPTFGTQYGAPGPAVGGHNEYDFNQYQAYGPTQMRSPMLNDSPYPNPAYPQQAYGQQSPYSPVSPVAMNPHDGQQATLLTRQPSSATELSRAASPNGPTGYPSEDPHFGGYHVPHQAEYVDPDRSSVTPYQAAQYAEISHQLNTEVPTGLDTPAVAQFMHSQRSTDSKTSPRMPSPSPFSDPSPEYLPYPSDAANDSAQNLDAFPVPPSPSHSRVDSIPPMLPEIHVESRPTSYDFPASVRGSDIPSGISKDYMKSPLGSQFPATPSPLASSFGIPTPPAAATSFPEAAPPTPRHSNTEAPAAQRPDTMYDDDDAYGGI